MNRRSLSGWIRKPLHRLLRKSSPATAIEVERSEQTFYINYLQEGMVVFDAGANIGELTLLFSRFVGQYGKVHAFEASSTSFKRLSTICSFSGRKNIILNHRALADKEEYVKLYVYDDDHSGWNSLADRPLQNYGIDVKPITIEEVEAVTIDGYCKKNNISRIDLLKIDVEGAEYQVLLGARHMLESHSIRCCVFEFGATTFDMGNDPNEIEAYLKQFGYRIRNVVKGNQVFPGRSIAAEARFSVHVARPIDVAK